MAEHDLKTWPPFFDHVADGRKTFEVRRNDRGFQYGDTLLLREWNPHDAMTSNARHGYTGRECRVHIDYVLDGDWPGLKPGYVVLGISRAARTDAGSKQP